MKKILLIDNYDSFSFNLAHALEEHPDVKLDIVRNTEIPKNIYENYNGVLLSPGPGIPSEAGGLVQFIHEYKDKLSIFGVCLGHQAITEALGGSLLNTSKVYHGIASEMLNHKNDIGILKDLGEKFMAGRYHSWVAKTEDFPADLEITATIDDGTIMAFQHKFLPIYGVQFHPESILTPKGKQIIFNWVETINKNA